jgi:nitrite reductase/ring-hydroxylating ferredoxin subunit
MGDIPVASPSPIRRWRLSKRAIIVAVLGVASLASIAMIVAVSWPGRVGGTNWTDVGRASDFEVNQPVRIAEQKLYVVKMPSGDFVALSQTDPQDTCTVPWRSDFQFMDHKGWFRNPCHGQTYDLNGHCVSGPCVRDMDWFPVRAQGGLVQVDLAHRYCGNGQLAGVSCDQPPAAATR